MKPFLLIILLFFIINKYGNAQNTVVDTHPTAIIYAIDPATGQENANQSDQAILFKDALIELVSHTSTAKMHLSGMVPGHKNFVITQMNPQTNGNAYQLVLQSKIMGQVSTLYTFLYNVDENTLSFYDQQSQAYQAVNIEGYNINNQNNCFTYGKFNSQAPQAEDPAAQASVAIPADQPVDQDVSVKAVPPDMPEYQQPPCPTEGYLWQPGYWAYSADSNGYYWVPGAWVGPPTVGVLWTPPYWGLVDGLYVFNGGYWGEHVGFYGGINYGYGYGGSGYGGGEWYRGRYRYNTAVTNVNTTVIRSTYVNNTVVNNTRINNRASFNGAGGVVAKPSPKELAVAKEKHVAPTAEQNRNQQIARSDKSQFAANNGGKPANVAVAKVPAKGPVNNNAAAGGKPGMNGAGTNRSGINGQNQAKPGINGTTSNKPGVNGQNQTRPGMNGTTSNPAAPGGGNSRLAGSATGSHPVIPGSGGAKTGMPGQSSKSGGFLGMNKLKSSQAGKAVSKSKSNNSTSKKN